MSAGPYRIATVAELTGVPEPTLRAWERRYGIPSPERTASGYRLYGADEVAQVLEMRRLCDEEGLATAEAAKRVLERKQGILAIQTSSVAAIDLNADAYRSMVDAIVDAVARFDDADLEIHLRRAKFLGTAGQIFDRILAPALIEIGDRWHSGELNVAQEHFATHKISLVARDLVRLAPGSDSTDCALFASFADDEHEVGVLGFALRVAELGTRPIFLGARTPPSAVRATVEALEPKLVGLSVTVTPSKPRARELIDDYAAACGTIPWVVGGSGSEPLRELVEKQGGVIAPTGAAELRTLIQPWLSAKPKRST